MQHQRLEFLFERFVQQTATAAEKEELFELIRSQDNEDVVKQLAERYPVPDSIIIELPYRSSGEILAAILSSGDAPVRRLPLLHRFRWAAAALLIGVTSVTAWLLLSNREEKTAGTTTPLAAINPPGSNRATIQLADGKIVYLDQAVNGELATMGNVQLVKLADGRIVYDGKANEESFNTLTNPKSSQPIDIGLSDGTHVWLNAGSSVTYPVAFVPNKERIVSMTGEAYFEVVHNEQAPFKVKTADQVVEDLGTSFNINAYPGEEGIKTTLVEGSLQIDQSVLRPGQQYLNGKIAAANVEQALAWKNGFFGFDSADIHTVMREVGRWYDTEVKFENLKDIAPFQGKISRTISLAQLLKNLEMYGVRFRFENNTIVVSPGL